MLPVRLQILELFLLTFRHRLFVKRILRDLLHKEAFILLSEYLDLAVLEGVHEGCGPVH
jgi:hypothetical protein